MCTEIMIELMNKIKEAPLRGAKLKTKQCLALMFIMPEHYLVIWTNVSRKQNT